MSLPLLSLPRLAALGAGLLLAALLAWQHLQAVHWRTESGRFQQLYTSEQLALANTVAGYRAAADTARADDLANVQRVSAAQQTITRGTQNELEQRLAAARADDVRLRQQAANRAADPGARRAAPVSGLPASTGGAAEGTGENQLPPDDALTATEQAIQLDELIEWVKRQSAVDPNGNAAEPRALIGQHRQRPGASIFVAGALAASKGGFPMSAIEQVREHMKIIGADGAPIGTVDRVEGDRIKMIRHDSGMAHEQHHHFIPQGLVADVEGDTVRLSANGDVVADLFEEESSGQPIG